MQKSSTAWVPTIWLEARWTLRRRTSPSRQRLSSTKIIPVGLGWASASTATPTQCVLMKTVTKRTSTCFKDAHRRELAKGLFSQIAAEPRFAPCVMISGGCHAAGIDEGVPSCASRVMARGGVCFTGAARCPTAIATLWGVAFYNELLYEQLSSGNLSISCKRIGNAAASAIKTFVQHPACKCVCVCAGVGLFD